MRCALYDLDGTVGRNADFHARSRDTSSEFLEGKSHGESNTEVVSRACPPALKSGQPIHALYLRLSHEPHASKQTPVGLAREDFGGRIWCP